MKERLGTIFSIYVSIGAIPAAVKMISVITWTGWYSWGLIFGDSTFATSLATFGSGLLGVVLTLFLWPVSLYQTLSGSMSFGQWLLWPWVQ